MRLKERSKQVPAPKSVKLNAGQCGFYLTHYDDEGWSNLAETAEAFSALDRFGLQSDAYSLMRAGYLPVATYLKLVRGFRGETSHRVWSGLVSGLRALTEIFAGNEQSPRLAKFARDLLRPSVDRVGWEERPGEASDQRMLRTIVLAAASYFGDGATIEAVQLRFEAARKDLSAVPPDLQGLVFTGAALHDADDVLDALMALYEQAPLPETKVQLLKATGAFRREAPLRRAVAYTLHSGKVRPQDSVYVFSGTPIETRAIAWALVKENWKIIDQRFGGSSLLASIISAAAGGIASEAHAKDVEAFFKTHPVPKAAEAIKHTLEGIRARASFRARNRGALEAYFG
jgi:aminopeptidase N